MIDVSISNIRDHQRLRVPQQTTIESINERRTMQTLIKLEMLIN